MPFTEIAAWGNLRIFASTAPELIKEVVLIVV